MDVNDAGEMALTALMRAATVHRLDVLRILLEHPDIEVYKKLSTGYTALMFLLDRAPSHRGAKLEEYKIIIRLFLSADDLDVNAQHINGGTALHYACDALKIQWKTAHFTGESYVFVVKSLTALEGRLNPSLPDKFGHTPLDLARRALNLADCLCSMIK